MKHPRRSQAAQRWRAVATGQPDADTLEWLASVARKVLKANELPAAIRRDAMVQAVGLRGTDNYEALAVRSLIDHVDAMPGSQFGGAGRAAVSARKALLRLLIRGALSTIAAPCQLDDDAIDARIRRARKLEPPRPVER